MAGRIAASQILAIPNTVYPRIAQVDASHCSPEIEFLETPSDPADPKAISGFTG
jgi:hypothetical protein